MKISEQPQICAFVPQFSLCWCLCHSKRDKDLLKLIFLRTLKNRSWQWSSRASETGDGFNVVSTNDWQCHQIQLIQHKSGTKYYINFIVCMKSNTVLFQVHSSNGRGLPGCGCLPCQDPDGGIQHII